MGILKQWRDKAYDERANKGDLQRLWSAYFAKEKDIYAELLKNPDEVVTGTVKELAEKYDVDLMTMEYGRCRRRLAVRPRGVGNYLRRGEEEGTL